VKGEGDGRRSQVVDAGQRIVRGPAGDEIQGLLRQTGRDMGGNGCLGLVVRQLQENVGGCGKVLDQPVIEQVVTAEDQDGVMIGQPLKFIRATTPDGISQYALYPLL